MLLLAQFGNKGKQNALDYFSNWKDILLIEEAVVKTNKNNFISITQAVKNYVN